MNASSPTDAPPRLCHDEAGPIGEALARLQDSPQRIVVRLVPRAGFGPAEQKELDQGFRARLGEAIEIAYEIVEAIPRQANGKFRAVVSQLEAGRNR